MTEKVARVHGEHDTRLAQVRDTFATLTKTMNDHTQREEQVVFPAIRDLEAGRIPCAGETIAAHLRQMEAEHDGAGAALAKLRELTDGYRAPDWACNTYCAMLDGLQHFEHDLHQHVHKENNILHPRALALAQKAA
jgi:regulator of cell morphogenesis and NO signaling